MSSEYASVRILDIAYQADRPYVYYIEEHLRDAAVPGATVTVPFGRSNRRVTGIITGLSDECDFPAVKPLLDVIRGGTVLSDEILRLCLFMHGRYCCSFGSAVKAVLPPGTNMRVRISYSAASENTDNVIGQYKLLIDWISSKGTAAEIDIVSEFGSEALPVLDLLVSGGYLKRHIQEPRRNEKNITLVRLTVQGEEAEALLEDKNLTEKQKELVVLLMHYPRITLSEVEDIGGISASVVNAVCKKGFCEKISERVERIPYADADRIAPDTHVMNSEQQAAYDELTALADSGTAKAALLLGVTGSGKTKVITETVKHVIQSGRTAVILLPEIGLTAQAMRTYKAVFGEKLTIIHSMLSAGERTDAYRAIEEGRISVVLGTRSAVFSPLKNIGIIVLDEEQESTYKSELSPKYHARDIASFRAGYNKCLLLLASATPSVESYYKALKGSYSLIKLTKRIAGHGLPEVIIQDIRGDRTLLPDKLIGSALSKEISDCISDGNQAILFANRRGFNSQVACRSCGTVLVCPNCSVALTYHAYTGDSIRRSRLACHYCGYTAPVPDACPECGSKHVAYFGYGTQKLQDEIEEKFPDIAALRMDADTTAVRYSHDRLLEKFRSGQAELLFGTQMVCKGLDFPKVTLAAVISVDSLLYMNDFRASERTFSLLTQLIGRAGRADCKGKALLQTMNPENEVLRLAAAQDYEEFAKGELAFRKSVLFPPFCGMAAFTVSAETEDALEYYLTKFPSELCRFKVDDGEAKIRIYGPYREGIYKVGGMYRQKIIVKYSDNAAARKYLSDVYAAALTHLPPAIRLDLDINPAVV